jgi:hypothetical protein
MAEDLKSTRHATPSPSSHTPAQTLPLQDAEGHLYRIRELAIEGPTSELRWTRSRQSGCDETFDVLTVRGVVACLDDYEPARTLTSEALALHSEGSSPSAYRLRAELERLTDSV